RGGRLRGVSGSRQAGRDGGIGNAGYGLAVGRSGERAAGCGAGLADAGLIELHATLFDRDRGWACWRTAQGADKLLASLSSGGGAELGTDARSRFSASIRF